MKTCFAVAALLTLAPLPHPALAQARNMSGNEIYAGCKNGLAEKLKIDRLALDSGFCFGIIAGIIHVGPVIRYRVCPPEGGTFGQALKVVVAYMDQNPAQLHEAFPELANRALREAWPCP